MKNITRCLSLLTLTVCLLSVSLSAFSSDVMIQVFSWSTGSWSGYQGMASTYGSAGFTLAWFPPCSDTADTHGYLPRQWYLYSGPYGDQSALTGCIGAYKSAGMTVLADVVVNHRCGNATAQYDFVNPAFGNNQAAVCNNDECGCGTGAADTGAGYNAARDLDHTSSDVQSYVKAYISSLKGLGFGGCRFDMVTGYGASYCGMYASGWCVGEYWDTSTGNLNNWANSSGVRAFDFATKSTLNAVFNNNNYSYLSSGGKAPGLIGVNPSKAVTFVGNHDTEGQSLMPMPSGGVEQAYVYILTHPGTPCVYAPHYSSYSSTIRTLISLRNSAGISATSTLTILSCTTSLYAAQIGSGLIMKIGPGSYSPGGNWTLAASGNNWAVWTSGGTSSSASSASSTTSSSLSSSGTSSSSGGGATTTIKANYDVGMGNTMYVRGSVSPLNWTTGAAMTWTTGNVWAWSTTSMASGTAYECKFLINDTTWSDGANYTGTGGSTLSATPTFTGNFYDTMDSLKNWTVSGYTGAGKFAIYNYTARAYGCTSESVLTLKFYLSEYGKNLTLAFKTAVSNLTGGEYLAADCYNGSAWKQVVSLTGSLKWTNVAYKIASYTNKNFKIRFRAKMTTSNSTKAIYVDNVTVASNK